jgi:RNA-directed DNA polymerase
MKFKLLKKLQGDHRFKSLLLLTPSKHYKVYQIPKRKLGFRTIAQPTSAVKNFQRKIITLLVSQVKLHDSAMAYREGLSIKDNAEKHKKSTYILKIDFENFFNSLTPRLFFKALDRQSIKYSKNDKHALEETLFWNRSKRANGKLVLSVGAPSSPLISNLVMYSFDQSIQNMCDKKNVIYTRYADDLTFSTNEKGLLIDIFKKTRLILKKEFGKSLQINESKTIFSSKGHNRHVTGVTLTNNNKLSLGREKKRYISALIHKYKFKKLEEGDIEHLKGLISHAQHIEPDFISRMVAKYGKDCLLKIKLSS